MKHGQGTAGDQQMPPKGFRRKVTSAFGATFLVVVADRLLDVVFLAVLARVLHPAEFGVAAASTVTVSFLTQLAQLGMMPTLIQARALTPRTIAVARTLLIGMAVLVIALAEVLAPAIGQWFRSAEVGNVVRLSIFSVLAQALAAVPQALLARGLRARDIGLVDLGCSVIGIGMFAIPLAFMGMSYWSLIIGYLISGFSRAILLWWVAKAPSAFGFHWAEARALWGRGAGFALTVFLHKVGTEGDRLIIGRFLTPLSLGLYSRANGLMCMPAIFFGGVVDRVAFPAFSQVQHQTARLGQAYRTVMGLTALAGLPLTVFLVFMGPAVIRFVLGAGWEGAVAPFKILCLATYFRLSDRVSGTLLRGLGKPYLMAAIQTVLCTSMVVGCLLGVRSGLQGVSVAVLAVATLSYLLLTLTAARAAKVSLLALGKAHVAGGLLALVVALALQMTVTLSAPYEMNSFVTLVAGAAAAGGGALMAVLLAPKLFLGEAGLEALKIGIGIARDMKWPARAIRQSE